MPLNNLDFQSELAKIASLKPDAIFTFMPGGMGVNLVKQYRAGGLVDRMPFLSAFTVDESTLPAQQDAAIGLLGGSTWAPNLDNPRTRPSSRPTRRPTAPCPAPTPCRPTTRRSSSTRA